MSQKLSSYQKQKQRIAKLEKDIHTLLTGQGVEKTLVESEYRMKYDFQNAVWAGSPTKTATT